MESRLFAEHSHPPLQRLTAWQPKLRPPARWGVFTVHVASTACRAARFRISINDNKARPGRKVEVIESHVATERHLHLTPTNLPAAHRRGHPRENDGCKDGPS